ncbi:MAG: phosphoenolpyruvate synthase [Gammaproteobacteria bacterium]|nr:phosphoenolpyruvate synthase [Gammaproteobacteria bacterium]
MNDCVINLAKLSSNNLPDVGGKNASLGEMIQNLSSVGISVPGGFATTSYAFQMFLQENRLKDEIAKRLSNLDVDNISALSKCGDEIRNIMLNAKLPEVLEQDIRASYKNLEGTTCPNAAVAVRSSATAEDLPEASFAGQQESYLNVCGIDEVLSAVRKVFASLYNDRAIAYRVHKGFEHAHVSLSAGVQQMVRSDLASSGVMFTLDTESGCREVVLITASYGLGETIVQGQVNPDEFYVSKSSIERGKAAVISRTLGSKLEKMVFRDKQSGVDTLNVDPEEQIKFCISNEEVEALAQMALKIEQHYKRPMDIEWAKDGIDGKLYIVQARPETVQSQTQKVIEKYSLREKSTVLTTGRSIGSRIGAGNARVIQSLKEIDQLQEGEVLVTDMTDPDWEPVMKRAAAIVTNRGGRTCHAAIIARELGVPAVVGCSDATNKISTEQPVTVSCAEGDTGNVYSGLLNFDVDKIQLEKMPEIPCKIMLNVGNPERAFSFAQIPNAGVGLARLEFVINNMVGIHPRALLDFDTLPNEIKSRITEKISAYDNSTNFYISKLTEGIATLATAFEGKPVILRLSDFKSNEYANLLGGNLYEPEEENPMIGYRGASRYLSEMFQACFEMECKAVHGVRNEMGCTNIQIMIPFVRTIDEAKQVTELLGKNGLVRGENDLKVIMMCEVPSNALLAEQFLQYFDGFSIGSNDLTQMTLGLDRDSELIAEKFDERNDAVKSLIRMAIQACKQANKYVGICGQGPSDYPDFAKWLIEQKIDSLSLNPDSVLSTWMYLSKQ